MPAAVGTVWVDVRFNVGDIGRQLQAALAGATAGAGAAGAGAAALERTWMQSLGSIGDTATRVGKQMTVGLTLPLTLIGKAAVSAYHDFDAAMTQITAINQIPIATTNEWRDSVRELGRTYGVAAEDAAKGLYFITSSGVDASNAMEVLEVAIKGSAVGLGETKVVADVLTSALSAYGEENITAAKAADQLTAAVRLGKGEADDLAGSLSQVIPIAANMGVEFGEVTGAMAAMTLSGTSSDQAATQLRGLFNTLQDMPPIAQRALKQYTGIDYATTRLALKNEGLIPTLKAIYDGFEGNNEAMAEVFGNIRALTGVFNLFGENTQQTLDIVAQTTAATGDLGKAWENTAESDAKKLDRAMNDIHDSMVGLGKDLIPIATGAANVVGGLGQAFGRLGDPLQNTIVGFGALAAAAGPVAFVFGKMAQGIAGIGTVLTKIAPSLASVGNNVQGYGARTDQAIKNNAALSKTFGSLGGAIGGVTTILAAGVVAWNLYQGAIEKAEASAKDAENQSRKGASGGIEAGKKQVAQNRKDLDAIGKDIDEWQRKWNSFDPFNRVGAVLDVDAINARAEQGKSLDADNERIQKNIDLAETMARKTSLSADALYLWIDGQNAAGVTYANAEDALTAYNKALAENDSGAQKVAQSTLKASNSISGIIAKAKVASDAFFGVVEAEDKVEGATKGLADARKGVTAAEDNYRQARQKTLEAGLKIGDAERKAVDASRKLRDARLALVDAEKELADARRGPSEEEQLDVRSAQIAVQEAQKRMRGPFEDPLDRQKAQIDLRRSQIELQRVRGEHAKRLADAEKGVESAQDGVNAAVQAEMDAQAAVISAREARTQASKDEATAFDAIATAQEGVRDAEYLLYQANRDLAISQDLLKASIEAGTIKGDEFMDMLNRLRDMYPGMAGTLDDYANKFSAIFNSTAKPAAPAAPTGPKGEVVNINGEDWVSIPGIGLVKVEKQRAYGGPLKAGEMSTVNERGMPELWSAKGKQYLLPTAGGQVTPLKPLNIDVKAQGGDGITIGDIYVQGATTPTATAYEVRRQIRAKGI
jgi:TP901 family phage tail tape measure protein